MEVRMDKTTEKVSVTEVAERLSVTTRTVTRWITQGCFPNAYKKNPYLKSSPYVIPLEDVESFEALARESTKAYPVIIQN
jgi:predicted site-specific integrase-resolvase